MHILQNILGEGCKKKKVILTLKSLQKNNILYTSF
jgi:hypothetical protein